MSGKLTLLGRPEIRKTFDGLHRLLRRYKVQGVAAEAASLDTDVFIAYATADAEFANALLVDQYLAPRSAEHNALDLELVRVYQEFTAATLVSVGKDQLTKLPDGRTQLVRTSVCLASEAEGLAPAIGAVVSSRAVSNVHIIKDGVGAQVVVTYISAGKISESTRLSHNGALSVKTLVYFNEVPPTPADHILVDSSKTESEGVPTYTYTFAKGTGVISSSTNVRNTGKLVTYRTVKLSPSGAGVPPSTPAATIGGTVVLIGSDYREDSGYILYTYEWAEGFGTLSTSVSTRYNGKLSVTTIRYIGTPDSVPAGTLTRDDTDVSEGVTIKTRAYSEVISDGIITSDVSLRYKGKLVIYRIVKLGGAPNTPAATIAGTVVLVSSATRQEDGLTIYDYTWAEGKGIIETRPVPRSDGLRELTYVSLGTKETPTPGVVIRDESDEMEGVTKYTVTVIQRADGLAAPTSGTITFERYVPFLYPGRMKPFDEVVENTTLLDVFLSPPLEVEVLATVTVNYQTSDEIGALPEDKWQPTSWATLRAQWIGLGGKPSNTIQAYRGYRSVDETRLEFDQGTFPGTGLGSIFGNSIYGGTTGWIEATGGPEDPAGNDYTLDAQIDLAFVAVDGTKYYRRTITTATIPAQDALPV